MAGMGPPPKAAGTRARRNAGPGVTTLSSSARRGKKAPPWPLPDDVRAVAEMEHAEDKADRFRDQLNATSDRRRIPRLERELDAALLTASVLRAQLEQRREMETRLWAELWTTPQAAMWEQFAWIHEVAQYVRQWVKGTTGDDLDALKEARQWSDRLGLNPLAMLRLRWEVERVEEAADRGNSRRQRQGAVQPPKGADPRSVLRAVK